MPAVLHDRLPADGGRPPAPDAAMPDAALPHAGPPGAAPAGAGTPPSDELPEPIALSPVARLIREPEAFASVLQDLTARFASTAAVHDRDASFPHANFAELKRLGLIAAVVPTCFGGGGASLATASRLIAAVARGEPATALVLTMAFLQHRLISQPESRWPERLRESVLRSAVTEGALINALRVEPLLGSPARGGLPATIARRTPQGWRLSGHKLYSTGIPALRWLAVWGRTDDAEPRTGFFLVPREAAGIRVVESWDHLGLRASGSHDVIFDEVALGADQAVDLRLPADWARGPDPDQQAWMVGLLGALYDGVAQAARDWLLAFLNQRAPGSLGAPLATLPRVQERVGEIEALLLANQALLTRSSRATDAGAPPATGESGLVKYLVSEHAIRAVDLALQLTGNHGLARRNPLERHHRDVLCSRIHAPQDDSILVVAGRLALEGGAPI